MCQLQLWSSEDTRENRLCSHLTFLLTYYLRVCSSHRMDLKMGWVTNVGPPRSHPALVLFFRVLPKHQMPLKCSLLWASTYSSLCTAWPWFLVPAWVSESLPNKVHLNKQTKESFLSSSRSQIHSAPVFIVSKDHLLSLPGSWGLQSNPGPTPA